MAIKSMGYDNPAYLARLAHCTGAPAAGATATSAKFIAWSALQIYSITAALLTVGTSTQTAWNGTATITEALGHVFSVLRVFNTAAAGLAAALATATYGPFALGHYNGTATATQTAAAGDAVNVALSGTGTGAVQAGSNAATGGFPINQGDQLFVVSGTDATAVADYTFEYGLQPLANETA